MRTCVEKEVLATALAVAQAATVYSTALKTPHQLGFMSLLIVTTAGSITVTQQVSMDGTTFYDAVDSDGNALGAVVAAMTVGTKYIQFSPVLAPHIRFKIVEGNSAPTAVSLNLAHLKDER